MGPPRKRGDDKEEQERWLISKAKEAMTQSQEKHIENSSRRYDTANETMLQR